MLNPADDTHSVGAKKQAQCGNSKIFLLFQLRFLANKKGNKTRHFATLRGLEFLSMEWQNFSKNKSKASQMNLT